MIDSAEIITLLDSALGQHKAQGHNEYLWHCPFCSHHKPKLAVNIQTGMWHCWVCATGGRTLVRLLRRVNAPRNIIRQVSQIFHQPIKFESEKTYAEMLTLPPEFKPMWEVKKDFEYKAALRYLIRRGITANDIIRYQIGYCTAGDFAHRIIIPSYDEDGKLNFFVARAYRNLPTTYQNPEASKNVVGFESLISWEFPIVICEGPFDAIAIRRNAIPIFGKVLPSAVYDAIIINGVEDVYLALDSDAIDSSLLIAQKLIENEVNVHILQLDEQDPADLGFEKMQELIRSQWNPDTIGDIIKMRASLI